MKELDKNKYPIFLILLILLMSCSKNDNNNDNYFSDINDPFVEDIESISEDKSVSDSTITESEIPEGGTFKIDSTNIVEGDGNSYPIEGEYEIEDKTFYIANTMVGSGKLEGVSSYIQMRKETGLIRNVDAFLGAAIQITIHVNESSYVGDMTHELTVKAGNSYNSYDDILTCTSSRDDNYLYCFYESACSYQYFSLENISSYASYIKEIKFIW